MSKTATLHISAPTLLSSSTDTTLEHSFGTPPHKSTSSSARSTSRQSSAHGPKKPPHPSRSISPQNDRSASSSARSSAGTTGAPASSGTLAASNVGRSFSDEYAKASAKGTSSQHLLPSTPELNDDSNGLGFDDSASYFNASLNDIHGYVKNSSSNNSLGSLDTVEHTTGVSRNSSITATVNSSNTGASKSQNPQRRMSYQLKDVQRRPLVQKAASGGIQTIHVYSAPATDRLSVIPKTPTGAPAGFSSSPSEKRQSRFPWNRRASSSSNPRLSMPQISEPVLEYSTANLFSEQATYISLSRAGSMRTTGKQLAQDLYASNRLSTHEQQQFVLSGQMPNATGSTTGQDTADVSAGLKESMEDITEGNFSPISHRTGTTTASSHSSGQSLDVVIPQESLVSLSAPLDLEVKPTIHTVGSVPSTPIQQEFVPETIHEEEEYEDQMSAHDGAPKSSSELVWRQKLRVSEDNRRNIMIEYQQKLDAERRRNVELEKKLEEMILAKSSLKDEQQQLPSTLNSKIRMLETQREALRQALTSLRDVKDREINELHEQIERLKKNKSIRHEPKTRLILTGTLTTDDKSPSSSLLQSQTPVRTGIGPLLPFSAPVDISMHHRF